MKSMTPTTKKAEPLVGSPRSLGQQYPLGQPLLDAAITQRYAGNWVNWVI